MTTEYRPGRVIVALLAGVFVTACGASTPKPGFGGDAAVGDLQATDVAV